MGVSRGTDRDLTIVVGLEEIALQPKPPKLFLRGLTASGETISSVGALFFPPLLPSVPLRLAAEARLLATFSAIVFLTPVPRGLPFGHPRVGFLETSEDATLEVASTLSARELLSSVEAGVYRR